ncbi:hypothetical protein SBV1_1280028 [Verrucomicrobia bacterium]|nr:hypothetical protein SBV1_1280028 [Verrucomicrobiota bacterium]
MPARHVDWGTYSGLPRYRQYAIDRKTAESMSRAGASKFTLVSKVRELRVGRRSWRAEACLHRRLALPGV